MIRVSNISKAFGSQELFREVSFSINSKERIGLVGRNGHGKTTLFRLLLKLDEPDSGKMIFPRNYTVGYLQQQLQFSKASVLEEVCIGLPVGQEHDAWRAEKILFGLGFSQQDMARPPDEFSGGFQVRLNLAKVLVSEPHLMLLDEPTNYLDIISIRWLARFLQTWPNELMLITHDRSFMDSVTTHTIGIHRESARKIAGGTDKLYAQIAADEEIYEKTRVNDEKKRKEVELFIRRFRAKARLANMVQSRIKTLQKQEKKDKLQRLETLEFALNSAPFPAKVMSEVENIAYSYGPDQPFLFENLNLTIGKRDRICIVGENGKGKTTLLKVLAGDYEPKAGQIRNHPSLQVGCYEQTNTARLDPKKTVVEELMSTSGGCNHQRARDIAGTMMFAGDAALKRVSVLSGGEKSRLLLGKLLVGSHHLLLLDEPTNHLDMESCDSMLAAIDSFEGSVVLVTHNEMFLHTLATRLIVFDRGKQFLYDGSYRNFLDEIGWHSDESEKESKLNLKKPTHVPTNSADRKKMRKARAELSREKSRVLKPLQDKIKELEALIASGEKELSDKNQQLIAASTKGDGAAIAALAKDEGVLQGSVNGYYDELGEITERYEEQTAQFESRLANL